MSRAADAIVAGVDEAGRGPLAGSVVAAAVVLDPGRPVHGVADSKALTARTRERLAAAIRAQAISFAFARASVEEIEALNILRASLLAMSRAVEALAVRPALVLVDGNQVPDLDCEVRSIVSGDVLVAAISAASILAKVERDREMTALDRRYPEYGFASNKGYPTRAHRLALQHHGPCPAHRRTFAPVRRILQSFPCESEDRGRASSPDLPEPPPR